MSAGLVALIAWAVATLGLLIAGWPRGAEREVLAKSPRHLRLMLFLPSSSWRRVMHPVDPGRLLRVRRLSLATALAILCSPLLLLGDFDRGDPPPGGSPMSENASDTDSSSGDSASAGSNQPASPEALDPAGGRTGDSEQSDSGGPEVVAEPESGDVGLAHYETLPPLNAEEMAKIRTTERLYDDAKINPHYAGNDLLGVRIRSVGPGSFWHRVGLSDEDLIVEINGTRIDTGTATNQLMNALAGDAFLRIRVVSPDGESRVLDFKAPDS